MEFHGLLQGKRADIQPETCLLSILCQKGLAEDFRLIYNTFGNSEKKIVCNIYCNEMFPESINQVYCVVLVIIPIFGSIVFRPPKQHFIVYHNSRG